MIFLLKWKNSSLLVIFKMEYHWFFYWIVVSRTYSLCLAGIYPLFCLKKFSEKRDLLFEWKKVFFFTFFFLFFKNEFVIIRKWGIWGEIDCKQEICQRVFIKVFIQSYEERKRQQELKRMKDLDIELSDEHSTSEEEDEGEALT